MKEAGEDKTEKDCAVGAYGMGQRMLQFQV